MLSEVSITRRCRRGRARSRRSSRWSRTRCHRLRCRHPRRRRHRRRRRQSPFARVAITGVAASTIAADRARIEAPLGGSEQAQSARAATSETKLSQRVPMAHKVTRSGPRPWHARLTRTGPALTRSASEAVSKPTKRASYGTGCPYFVSGGESQSCTASPFTEDRMSMAAAAPSPALMIAWLRSGRARRPTA